MARVVVPRKGSFQLVQDYCRESFGDPLSHVSEWVKTSVDVESPFLVSARGDLLDAASRYLRSRTERVAGVFSLSALSQSSVTAYAFDLAYFLNVYEEPSLSKLRSWSANGRLTNHYGRYLESKEAALGAATIKRRMLVATEFLAFVRDLAQADSERLDAFDERRESFLTNHSNQRIAFFRSSAAPTVRRRHPGSISLLGPEQLAKFFDAFEDQTLAACAKTIYGTGMRRFELTKLKAGSIAAMQPTFPGGPTHLEIVGKGNKERRVEFERSLSRGLKGFLTSKHRILRAQMYSKNGNGDPYNDDAPVFLNRFGEPLSSKAITEGFQRASLRCGLKRTPYELRHEFAVQYLLNAYRATAKVIEANKFDAWLVRLMVEKADIVVIRLSRLLGHSSPETTKKHYLVMLSQSDPSIREAWCKHLDSFGMETL